MSDHSDHIAFIEEAEDDAGSCLDPIEGTRVYAAAQRTPVKERPNTGRTRENRQTPDRTPSNPSSFDQRDTANSDGVPLAKEAKLGRSSTLRRDSERDSRDQGRKRREKARRDREHEEDLLSWNESVSRSSRESQPLRRTRPAPPVHAATQPVVRQSANYGGPTVDNPAFYGIEPGRPGPARPGARRPASYYAGQPIQPPPSTGPWQHPPPFPVGTFPPPLYPQPSPMMAAPIPPPGPSPMEAPSYFDRGPDPVIQSTDRLKQRFRRPSSAMGGAPLPPIAFPISDYEPSMGPPLHRRPSQSGRNDKSRDRRDMPPPTWIPQRASSAMPTASGPFRPPVQKVQASPVRSQRPTHNQRRSVGFVDPVFGFDDDESLTDEGLFNDASPQPAYDPHRRPRAKDRRGSVAYEYGEYKLAPAPGRGSRRSSMYGSATLDLENLSLEDHNLDAAERYQNQVSGGKTPLTEKLLREANRSGGVLSSRSTHSTASRDESEYRRSNTTGFTRSSSGRGGNDDYNIKVPGGAIVRHGADGLEIECVHGGEITVSGPSRSRSGSDRGSGIFPRIEDSHTRLASRALSHPTRAPSQSDSQSRGYAPSHAPYDPNLMAGHYSQWT